MPLSRRELLLLTGATVIDAACGKSVSGSAKKLEDTPTPTLTPTPPLDKSPMLREYFNTAETIIKNPLYRASSVTIMQLDAAHKTHAFGHGGLFTNSQNEPYIMTQWHVVSSGDKGNFSFLVPGVGNFQADNLRWYGIPGRSLDKDPNVVCRPETSFKNELANAIAQGDVVPLREFVPYGMTAFNAVTVMADKGTIVNLSFTGYNEEKNRLTFKINDGRICKGFSGQPVLLVENDLVTNKSCGLVSEASYTDNPECSTQGFQLYVRPHN